MKRESLRVCVVYREILHFILQLPSHALGRYTIINLTRPFLDECFVCFQLSAISNSDEMIRFLGVFFAYLPILQEGFLEV